MVSRRHCWCWISKWVDSGGSWARERYEQIIAADRDLVGRMQRIQFTIGDHAKEIEPVQQVGGAHPAPGEDPSGVDASLQIYADDLGAVAEYGPQPQGPLLLRGHPG